MPVGGSDNAWIDFWPAKTGTHLEFWDAYMFCAWCSTVVQKSKRETG